MRKLDLTNYTVTMKVPDKANPGEEIGVTLPYRVKDSIVNLLFIPGLKLSGIDLIKQNVLAMKIEAWKDGAILLEEEEWLKIKKAVDTYTGFDRQAVELVRRVLDAPKVEVIEKAKAEAEAKAIEETEVK